MPTITDLKITETLESKPKENTQPHLLFLDGIRAVMALWVACGHGFQDFIHVVDHYNNNTRFASEAFFQQAFYAHFAVDVFIVLSGFCLMLPVAKQVGFQLSGGWQTYLTRRARRILPPYYAALLLALCMSWIRWRINFPNWESRAIEQVDFRPTAILAHIFLLQNMWDPWARAIDGPTWSVATEFQIYILFPLLLLPLWRRFKPILVIPIVSLLGVTIYFLSKCGLTSCSWYIGLFAMGMIACEMFIRRRTSRMRLATLLICGIAIMSAVIAIAVFNWMPIYMWALDLIIGVGTASLLVYFSSYSYTTTKPVAVRFLEWRPLVALGTFSYSFYLIHAPLLNLPVSLLLRHNASPVVGACTLLVALSVIIGIARLFYLYIELPSMVKKPA